MYDVWCGKQEAKIASEGAFSYEAVLRSVLGSCRIGCTAGSCHPTSLEEDDVLSVLEQASGTDTHSDAAWRSEVTQSLKALLKQPSTAIVLKDFSRGHIPAGALTYSGGKKGRSVIATLGHVSEIHERSSGCHKSLRDGSRAGLQQRRYLDEQLEFMRTRLAHRSAASSRRSDPNQQQWQTQQALTEDFSPRCPAL
ncbi:hypothetical protein WJX77_004606 [Trebouxia sp. C0004]